MDIKWRNSNCDETSNRRDVTMMLDSLKIKNTKLTETLKEQVLAQ